MGTDIIVYRYTPELASALRAEEDYFEREHLIYDNEVPYNSIERAAYKAAALLEGLRGDLWGERWDNLDWMPDYCPYEPISMAEPEALREYADRLEAVLKERVANWHDDDWDEYWSNPANCDEIIETQIVSAHRARETVFFLRWLAKHNLSVYALG